MFAPGIALGHVVGRFGCFFAGCCYGKPTDVAVGASRSPIRSPPPTSARRSNVPLHPTQLYEAGAELLILGAAAGHRARGRPFPGRTFWLYMLLYAVSRFVIEFYRGDPRGVVGMFSTSQFISLVLAPLADRHARLPRTPGGRARAEARAEGGVGPRRISP